MLWFRHPVFVFLASWSFELLRIAGQAKSSLIKPFLGKNNFFRKGWDAELQSSPMASPGQAQQAHITAVCTYLHLFAPNCSYLRAFSGKKRLFIFCHGEGLPRLPGFTGFHVAVWGRTVN